MKKYIVRLNVKQEINAENEDEALDIFWDDFHRNQAEEENAGGGVYEQFINVQEIKELQADDIPF